MDERNCDPSPVFQSLMKRSFLALPAVALAAAALPGAASAQVIEVGQTSTPLVAPTCPATGSCKIVLTRVTALQTLSDGVANPTAIHHAGELVGMTVGLSRISSNAKTRRADIKFLNTTYGGTPRGWLTVLRPYGPRAKSGWQVAASSNVIYFQHYLGQVAQFALSKPVPVVPGEKVALTVPTWAPVLAINLNPKKFAYRQSRSSNCGAPPSTQQAQRKIGQIAHYKCNYAGTRAEYSATEITTPAKTS